MKATNAKVLALGAALGLAGAAAAGERELGGDADAKGLRQLRIEARVGSVEVVGTDAERIAWKLRIEPDTDGNWLSKRDVPQAAVDGAKVRAEANGDTWTLRVELPRGADPDDVEEHWRVEVPKRFALDVDANVGQVKVDGVGGGVEAELNVGELRIKVPQGTVDAKVNVGDLQITSATRSPGRVELEANVGGANLRLEGKRIESSGFFAVGGSVSVSREGKDHIEAQVNVGNVSVEIE